MPQSAPLLNIRGRLSPWFCMRNLTVVDVVVIVVDVVVDMAFANWCVLECCILCTQKSETPKHWIHNIASRSP